MIEYIKKMWVDALRSGEYERGDGRLSFISNGRQRFCALGVLCDLAIKNDVDVEVRGNPHHFYPDYQFITYDQEKGVLPPSVMVWADIPFSSPTVMVSKTRGGEEFLDGDQEWDIGDMNDSGYSWEVIAEAIERSL